MICEKKISGDEKLDIKKKLKAEQTNLINPEKNLMVLKILISIFIAFSVSIIILIGYALLITYTNLSDKNLNLIVMIINIISVIIAGCDAAKIFKAKGWLWGIFMGFIYAFTLNIIGLIIFKKIIFTSKNLINFLICVSSGAVGGIIGINLKK